MERALNVVIPVYNEGENILRTLAEVDRNAPPGTQVYVVHDFPEDNTLVELPRFTGHNVSVQPLLNTLGPGVLNALKFGLQQRGSLATLVVMGDMSDDLAILGRMLEDVEKGAAVVCGSRYMRGGRHIGGPLLKKTLSRCAGLSLSWLVRFPTHDPSNSFKLYARDFLDSVTVESPAGFAVGIELVVKAWMAGRRVTEIPSTWRDRAAGASRFKLWAWLPIYLRWYVQALKFGLLARFRP